MKNRHYTNKSHDDPDLCGSVGWALSHKANDHWFNSHSGDLPGLWFGPWLRHIWEATDRCFSLTSVFHSLSPSLPFSIKVNKIFSKKSQLSTCHGKKHYKKGVEVSGRTLTCLRVWGLVLPKLRGHMLRSVTCYSHFCYDPSLFLGRLLLHHGIVRRIRALERRPSWAWTPCQCPYPFFLSL